MRIFFYLLLFTLSFGLATGCNGQSKSSNQNQPPKATGKQKLVGGGCDGCELMYIGMPANLNATDTSAGWTEKGQKLLVTGKVLKRDGKTPAPNVILYYWQTNPEGVYAPGKGLPEKAKRHGYLRGWVKTDAQGNYAIYTIRPGSYPNSNNPEHIHISIKEPDLKNEYYIDDLVFDDDKLLTGEQRKKLSNRGGSGILRVIKEKDMQVAEHNIILGLNIPDHPENQP